MQAVPTLELLSMDELNSVDMDDDFSDLNLDMYLSPEVRGGGRSDAASCCGVRQNLKTHIQRKRRERGELDDLTALANYSQDEQQDPQQHMSADEYEKRLRRRQQNRRAARKFREKKKVHAQGIIQDYRRLQLDNGRLQRYINELQRQKAELEEIVMQHSNTCQLVCPPSSLPAASDFSNIDLSSTDMSYLQELQFC